MSTTKPTERRFTSPDAAFAHYEISTETDTLGE